MWETELGGWQFEISSGKKVARPYLKNQVGLVAHTCNPSYAGGTGRRMVISGQSKQMYKTLSEKN
jgi:hypothetical protein